MWYIDVRTYVCYILTAHLKWNIIKRLVINKVRKRTKSDNVGAFSKFKNILDLCLLGQNEKTKSDPKRTDPNIFQFWKCPFADFSSLLYYILIIQKCDFRPTPFEILNSIVLSFFHPFKLVFQSSVKTSHIIFVLSFQLVDKTENIWTICHTWVEEIIFLRLIG